MVLSVLTRMLFFASMWKLLYANNRTIEIERHNMSYINGNWTYQPDTFKIPSRMCSGDISGYCRAMGGHSIGGCECKCNSERTTFGFYDDKWNCTENSKVRQHGGCSLVLLKDRTKDSALITVPLNLPLDIPYEMSTDLQRCYIIPSKSTYLLCNGSWEILDNNFVFGRFSVAGGDDTQFFTFNKTTRVFEYYKVKGTILRMRVGCYDEKNNIISNCLMLKMEGTLKCPKFSMPQLPSKPIPTTSTSELQTPRILRTSIFQPTTIMESSGIVPSKRHEKNEGEEDDSGNTGLIVGVAVGVICLTLIIVAIVIIKRQRTKRNTAVVRKSNKTVENVSYELGADNSFKFTDCNVDHKSLDQDEYSYAYSNAIALGRRNMPNNGRTDNRGPPPTVSNQAYSKVENLDKHGSPPKTSAAAEYAEVNDNPKTKVKNTSISDGPRFNKKGKAPQKKESQNEPFYNVLEDPAGSLNEPKEGREPPCYHVLEGPFSEVAPNYSVLEKAPSSDDPEYKSLDGPNPAGVYSNLSRGDGAKRPVNQTHNYNDTAYDSVGGIINNTSDIYQNLNRNDQMNADEYQALNK